MPPYHFHPPPPPSSPNGGNLSASVTRILSLSGFSPDLKTKDFQEAFAMYEGGFRIKWVNDTSLYLVFGDAGIAKKAYLRTLYEPPSVLTEFGGGTTRQKPATITPYTGPDALALIHTVFHNPLLHSQSQSHTRRKSQQISGAVSTHHHSRRTSAPIPMMMMQKTTTTPRLASGLRRMVDITGINNNVQSEPSSPTLPDIPSQPSLDSLISSELSSGSLSSSDDD